MTTEPRTKERSREPFLVPMPFKRSSFVRNPGGPTYRVLFYTEGPPRFEHRCRKRANMTLCPPLVEEA